MHLSGVPRLPVTAVLLSLLVLAGCETTSTHQVKVEATMSPPPAGQEPKSFWIKSRQADPHVESLRYHEAVGHIKTALSGRGLYEAPNEAAADMVIELDYGVAPKRTRMAVEDSRRSAARPDGAGADAATPVERRGEVLIDVGIFRKHLTLEARQNRTGTAAADPQAPEFLWRVKVENESEEKDLRKFVPILASATIDYIAHETGGTREIVVDENGRDVAFVKRGL